MQPSAVPVIDISPFTNHAAHDEVSRTNTAAAWDMAMTEVGFAVIVGHGVEAPQIDSLRAAAAEFFALPADVKATFTHGPYGNPMGGYTAMGTEAVSRSRDQHGSDGGADAVTAAADLVESFVYRAEAPTPEIVAAAACSYQEEMLRVLGVLHQITAAALGLPKDFFDEYYSPCAQVSLRLAFYPSLAEGEDYQNRVRYGEHTDYTGFTILNQDQQDVGALEAGGLQVLLRSGDWHAVQPVQGGLIVNIGDLYEVWTNGRWRSTVHRVLNPDKDSALARRARLTIPFFTGPNNEALIKAIPTCVTADNPSKYAPIKAVDHLLNKLAASNV